MNDIYLFKHLDSSIEYYKNGVFHRDDDNPAIISAPQTML
jgi:hypothetical protein